MNGGHYGKSRRMLHFATTFILILHSLGTKDFQVHRHNRRDIDPPQFMGGLGQATIAALIH